jgi:hypothetical protein
VVSGLRSQQEKSQLGYFSVKTAGCHFLNALVTGEALKSV